MAHIIEITFEDFKTLHSKNEGLVLLGAGGDLNEWVEGVSGMLKEEKIAHKGIDNFGPFYELSTSCGRTVLVMMFNEEVSGVEMGKLAMWRIRFGDCSWVSDYLVNYEKQHITLLMAQLS